jgi:MFS family permease
MAHPLPAPDVGHADHEAEKANHFAWNLRLNVVVELFWGFATSIISTSTILPVFLATLGASKAVIALVPGVQLAGYALLQLPSAYFTCRLRRRTRPMILVHLPICAAWLAAALVARGLAASQPALARTLFLACMGVSSLVSGIGIPMWADYLNRQTPAARRGRFFGWAFSAGSLAGIGGGFAAREMLASLRFPDNFALCFYVAACAMLIGLLPYLLVREADVPPAQFGCPSDFARHVREALAHGKRLRRLVAARWILEAGMMASAFYAVRALAVCGLPDSAAGTFTVILAGTGAVAMAGIGHLGEKVGFPVVMLLGGLSAGLATTVALTGQTAGHFYALFVLMGLAASCDWLSAMNLVIEFSPHLDKTLYQAMYNSLLVPARIGYPLLAGALAEHFGIPAVFRVVLVLQFLGVVAVALLVRDGRGRWPARREAAWHDVGPV